MNARTGLYLGLGTLAAVMIWGEAIVRSFRTGPTRPATSSISREALRRGREGASARPRAARAA